MAKDTLIARFSYECLVYLSFHPCSCGDTTIPNVLIGERDGRNVAVYEGTCESCGRPRRIEFLLGGDDRAPSTLVDAGQWLLAAEHAARQISGDLSVLPPEERIAALRNLERAIVALEEALKFVAADMDEVPVGALFSREGRALHSSEPGRFRRPRIRAVLDTFRLSAEALSREPRGRVGQ